MKTILHLLCIFSIAVASNAFALEAYQNYEEGMPLPSDPDPTASYEEQRKKLEAILPADSPDPTQPMEEQLIRLQGAQKLFDESDETACCALLCLLSPTQPSECAKCLAKYFAIEIWSKGKFRAGRTAAARLDFLNQCKTGDDNSASRANDQFGRARR